MGAPLAIYRRHPKGLLPDLNQLTLNTWRNPGIDGSDSVLLTTIDDERRIVQLRFAHRLFQVVITKYLGVFGEATAKQNEASKRPRDLAV